jgi:hypothetical protein
MVDLVIRKQPSRAATKFWLMTLMAIGDMSSDPIKLTRAERRRANKRANNAHLQPTVVFSAIAVNVRALFVALSVDGEAATGFTEQVYVYEEWSLGQGPPPLHGPLGEWHPPTAGVYVQFRTVSPGQPGHGELWWAAYEAQDGDMQQDADELLGKDPRTHCPHTRRTRTHTHARAHTHTHTHTRTRAVAREEDIAELQAAVVLAGGELKRPAKLGRLRAGVEWVIKTADGTMHALTEGSYGLA